MSANANLRHLCQDVLVDYFEHKLAEHQRFEIEEHLAVCDPCLVLAQGVRDAIFDINAWLDSQRRPTTAESTSIRSGLAPPADRC
jgi:hypothetical protein